MIAAKLDAAVRAVCPIDGVCPFPLDDKSKWRIDFKAEATAQQRSAAQGVVDAFDVTAALNPTQDELAAAAVDKTDRFRFEMDFAIENRVRALEGKAAITKVQYRNALIAAWKAMP